MQVNVNPILKLFDGTNQYTVPRYQRSYSWNLEQCRQLWEDIQGLMERPNAKHFVGSVVYVEESSGGAAGDSVYQVIDGQQRLTTVTLLLAALYEKLSKRESEGKEDEQVGAARVRESLLKSRSGEKRFKLILSQDDKKTLMHLLDPESVPLPDEPAPRVLENYKFFQELLDGDIKLGTLYETLWRLQVVDIDLNREHDNPQLIFESLNSTGLDLTQSDLARNYVLMTLPADKQEDLYDNFWHKMEGYFKGQIKNRTALFDYFLRDFVTVRRGLSQSPSLDKVYLEFKKYVNEKNLIKQMDAVVRDMHKMALYYSALVNPEQREKNPELRHALLNLQDTELDVWYPLGLHAYEAWQEKRLTQEGFIKVLEMTESYIYRRWVVGLSSAGLNKTFPALLPKDDAADYVSAVQDSLYKLSGKRRFPSDDEFRTQLMVRNLYTSPFRWVRYTLSRIERAKNKEFSSADGFTVEHIMPQNDKLSAEWREMLGENWQEVQDTHLHTLGNLTLTKYNSQMSDSPFIEKRDMEGGFKDTALRISSTLRDLEVWNEDAILQRAESLATEALKVWPPIEASDELRSELDARRQARAEHTVEAHLDKASPELVSLFEKVREAILDLHSDMQEVPTKMYIAYKVEGNITDIVLQTGKNALQCYLNIPYGELKGELANVEDITGKGRNGNGDAVLNVSSSQEIPAYLELVQQVLDYQLNRRALVSKSVSKKREGSQP